jgi:Transcriptional regulators
MPSEDILDALHNFSFVLMHLREEMMKTQHLSFTEVFLVSYLKKFGPARLSDLASLMGLTKPTMTHIVDNLEKRGFVRRKFGEEDRRTIFIHVEESAEKVFRDTDYFDEDFKRVLIDLDEETIEKVVNVINRLLSIITKKLGDDKNEQ